MLQQIMLHRESFAAFGYHLASFDAESYLSALRFSLNLSCADMPSATTRPKR